MKRLSLLALFVAFAAIADNKPPAPAAQPLHLVEASIADIQAQYRAGRLSPEDVVRMYLARIAAYDTSKLGQPLNGGVGQQPLNAFMHLNENALRDAHRQGDDLDDVEDGDKPLFGIPVILKDNVATADMPTTAGSVAIGASVPKKDATIAKKIRQAGAIILGKGTLTEYANFIGLGMPTGFSSQLRFQLFQVPGADVNKVGFGFNSYDPRIDPRNIAPVNDGRPVLATGGSSSGPGIAVGANLATVGIGTETSGSILSPSGQNMLVGIKPTLGLVSRHGILPITEDQDTAGPMAKTVTDAAKLLGVIAGFDQNDPATRACQTKGNCFSDYTKFLDKNALKGAHIAVPKQTYWVEFGLGAARTALIQAAVDKMTAMGATFDFCEIPSQSTLNVFGTCVTTDDVKKRRANTGPNPAPCSTVLLNGFKFHLNDYLADKDFGPHVSVSNSQIPVRTIHNLSDIIAFNDTAAHPNNPEVQMKYGQDIAIGSDFLTTQQDIDDYKADRAFDLLLTRTCGLDILFSGARPENLPAACQPLIADWVAANQAAAAAGGTSCIGKKFDAVLFPANFGANPPARAGYPSVIVPAGLFQPSLAQLPAGFTPERSPFGVTFSGPAFSEPKLIGFAFAYEQATHFRVPSAHVPALATDVR
ncbi:MAG TPA: amidase family protein [Myxococcales bacterium]|jgi:amidase|nr:amidase family protein [Myxococcales bacterium]